VTFKGLMNQFNHQVWMQTPMECTLSTNQKEN